MFDQAIHWVAPIATIIAAMMTAANLGARLTGWGFVIFTVGSLGWVWIGVATGQTSLIVANGVLTVINLVGCWRWLGRQRAIEDGGKSAKSASRRSSDPTLFTATGIAGMAVLGPDRQTVGKAVEGLIECKSGTISYVVVVSSQTAGIEDELRAVPRKAIAFHTDRIMLDMPRSSFDALTPLTPGDWPSSA